VFDEYITDGDVLRPQATLSRLRRWDTPVRMTTEFGASVPPEQQQKDRSTVSAYASRLSRASGLSITQTDVDPNFHVLVLSEDDRADYLDRIREIVPGIADSSLRAITQLPRDKGLGWQTTAQRQGRPFSTTTKNSRCSQRTTNSCSKCSTIQDSEQAWPPQKQPPSHG